MACSLGGSLATSFGRIKKGECGIGNISRFDTSPFISSIGAELPPGLDLAKYGDHKRVDNLAMLAAREAFLNAGLGPASFDSARAAVCFVGSSGEFLEVEERVARAMKGDMVLAPKSLHDPASATALIARELGLRGSRATVVTACSSGLMAVGQGVEWIRQGMADLVVTGGADLISRMVYSGFHSLKILSKRPCAPFDSGREGITLGEGAGVMILEPESHAKRRGANWDIEIAGHGSSCVSTHMTTPDVSGVAWARPMELALKDAGVAPDEIGYINAHGAATRLSDIAEAMAIKKVFGKAAANIPVSSVKSMIGHCLFAAGSVELVITALALKEGVLPPTINLENPDSQCPLNHIVGAAIETDIDYALCNSFGFGGSSASVALGKRGL
ncbi:3-oxoacyl-[acyl-carrier-protein] synthase, KASII [hydrothermal vent metagenome]|uniref:3-oxoacyl-[acyl-carrier-protein] synthase, KASII n=1 Tax=hydrothermal vent metagenome TaxID=652676 RepID=A0A3B1BTX9_9ZZZZ